ncbi:hypothetical protein BpHYR1_029856, partial [Brachionus plicatilis]
IKKFNRETFNVIDLIRLPANNNNKSDSILFCSNLKNSTTLVTVKLCLTSDFIRECHDSPLFSPLIVKLCMCPQCSHERLMSALMKKKKLFAHNLMIMMKGI